MWRDSNIQTTPQLRDRKQIGVIERRRSLLLIACVLTVTFGVTSMVVWDFASPFTKFHTSIGHSTQIHSEILPIRQLNPA